MTTDQAQSDQAQSDEAQADEAQADEAQFDVVVVGSGAAGMTAALAAAHHGLRAVVLEKTEWFGGSTARSGGGIWAPGNEVLRKAAIRGNPHTTRAHPTPA